MSGEMNEGRSMSRKLDGTVLTLSDLPPATWPQSVAKDEYRWTADDKANVVAAINGGLIARDAAFQRWRLSQEEYSTWENAAKAHGRSGLSAGSLRGVEFDQNNNPKYVESADSGETIHSGPFTLYLAARRVTCGEFEEFLTPKQSKTFRLFILRAGSIVSKDEIEQEVDSRAVVQLVNTLRDKLETISRKKWIKTYYRQGWQYIGSPFEDE